MPYRLAIAVALAVIWPRPAVAQQTREADCMDTAMTQAAMTRCSGEALDAADRRLQRLVAELHDSLPGPQRAQLDSAQQAWAAYAAIECRLEAAAYEGGSMYAMQVPGCRGQLAERRIAELAPLLCGGGAPAGQRCSAAERYLPPTRRRAARH